MTIAFLVAAIASASSEGAPLPRLFKTNDTLTVTMFSDAQCPCSAQFTADIRHLLDQPDFHFLDFRQYFVAGSKPTNCIHGEGECVVHRHFVCAQNMSTPDKGLGVTYRQSSTWLAFQNCAYGPCDGSAAIKGASHPCKTYTTLGEFTKNNIMKNCSEKVGLDWTLLNACGDQAKSGAGQQLMVQSAAVSAADDVSYGLQGLPVVRVEGMSGKEHVKTLQPIPITCGPTPIEVLKPCCTDHKCVRKEPLRMK